MMLKAQMQKYVSLEIENMRLRRLLEASERLGERILAAELISVDLDPFSHRVVVNKGSRHGIFVGQPLLDADGVYGQVVHVGPLSSTVMLITDPAHALPVQVSRTGLRAIAAGTGAMDRLDLLHIPNNADVAEGDLLISSGLGGVFPAGYPVGIVQSIKIDTTQPYAAVVATPMAELDKSREVMIVWKADAMTSAPAVTPVESVPNESNGSEIKQTP
jgi:rod shape-determining protein MreC